MQQDFLRGLFIVLLFRLSKRVKRTHPESPTSTNALNAAFKTHINLYFNKVFIYIYLSTVQFLFNF